MMTTRSDVRLCLNCGSELRGLLWISFLPNGGISIGFPDKTFVVPQLISRNESEPDKSSILNLAETGTKEAPVKNPHFTLHPPGYFHLKSQNGTVLVQGLVWTEPGPGEEAAPSLRFISNPIIKLPLFRHPPHGREVNIFELFAPNKECSVAIHIDFVRNAGNMHTTKQKIAHYFEWGGITIRILAFCVPSQTASLGYEIAG